VARANAERLQLSVQFMASDWLSAVDVQLTGRFDLIVSNPPYVAEGDLHLTALTHEPLQALTSGPDGLDDIRQIIAHPFESKHIDPFETTPIHRASEFAVEWSRQDPEAASQWVQTLPPGETKLRVQMNLAMNWKPYDPDAVDQWLGTLPADSRKKVEAFMKNGVYNDDLNPGE
jgi:methylase of polypeptide subunit release factors